MIWHFAHILRTEALTFISSLPPVNATPARP